MSTDRDVTRIVRSWLRTDEYGSADRVLNSVLDQLDTTHQRRLTWWPARRFPPMSTTLRIALATAAVVILAFLGIRFLGGAMSAVNPQRPRRSRPPHQSRSPGSMGPSRPAPSFWTARFRWQSSSLCPLGGQRTPVTNWPMRSTFRRSAVTQLLPGCPSRSLRTSSQTHATRSKWIRLWGRPWTTW